MEPAKSLVKPVWKYYRLFGLPGLARIIVSRAQGRHIELAVRRPGIAAPIFLRPRTTDISTFRQVFDNGDYAVEFPGEPRVIIDAGANVGFASIYFANRFPRARIIAIEPERSNFAVLEHNARAYAGITPLRAALWSENARVDVVDPGSGHWGFQTRACSTAGGDRIIDSVDALTVDRIMQTYALDHIDILKIDIEGAEKDVFADPSRWIAQVRTIIIELHDRFRPGCSSSVYDATQAFERRPVPGENVLMVRATPA